MNLIDKDALVAEIERIFKEIGTPPHKDSNCEDSPFLAGEQQMCKTILSFIDTLEVKEVEEDPVSEDLEEALAKEWKGYNDRGAATVDALEDNTQELAFAKGFYLGAKWGKHQAEVEIQAQSMALAHGCPKEPVSEESEIACEQLVENARKHKAETSSPFFSQTDYRQGVMDGAGVTKKEIAENLKTQHFEKRVVIELE